MPEDTELGLYDKYNVERINDLEGKHDDCPFFVLDIRHDPHAREALWAYSVSALNEFPQLAADLVQLLVDVSLEE